MPHRVPKDPLRILVVDDSQTMRRLIKAGLEADTRIRVVAEAASAREARDIIKTTDLDGVTLDIEMPGMNGLDFLRRLMAARPMPVVMLSSMTAEGSDAAIRALSLGAIDCFEKPRFGGAEDTFLRMRELLLAVHAGTSRFGHRFSQGPRTDRVPAEGHDWNGKIVLLGASTGGVDALETILKGFPANCPPTYVVQHMPAQFLTSFAVRLNGMVLPDVRLAANGDVPKSGRVLIAPGGAHHMVFRSDATMKVDLVASAKMNGHRPSVDKTLLSAQPHAPRAVAALLTGMGRDGADGMLALRRAGSTCIAQDAESSVVFGMPRAAVELEAVDLILPLLDIPSKLLELTTRQNSRLRPEAVR